MKITKQALKQIIKEEMENLVNEEVSSGYERKIEKIFARNEMLKDIEKVNRIRADKDNMDYMKMVVTRLDLNKDMDSAAAEEAFMKAFNNVAKKVESGEYSKKPEMPPESPEAERKRKIAFGQAMARGDYGKLD
jgi:hypothetical protein